MSHPIKEEGKTRFAMYLYECEARPSLATPWQTIQVWALDNVDARSFAAKHFNTTQPLNISIGLCGHQQPVVMDSSEPHIKE